MNRRAASALVAWCLVVAAGIVAVWLVISRVGAEVTDPSAMVVQPTGTVLQPTDPASRRGGDGNGGHRPKPSAGRSHGTATRSPSPTAPAPAPTAPSTTTTPPVVARSSTWQGAAGLVRVTCRGPSISLAGASPSPGWQISIGSRGPQAVEVELERREGERKSQVRAVCSGGSPRFTVHNTGEGDG